MTHILALWVHYAPQACGWNQIRWHGWSCVTILFCLPQTWIIFSSFKAQKLLNAFPAGNVLLVWNKIQGKSWTLWGWNRWKTALTISRKIVFVFVYISESITFYTFCPRCPALVSLYLHCKHRSLQTTSLINLPMIFLLSLCCQLLEWPCQRRLTTQPFKR